MGNCLVHEQEKKMVKLMRVDGKILEYLSPLKVHEALSGFPGHAIAESLPVVQHLNADADMVGGKLYYLLPPKKKTAVEPGDEPRSGTGASIVRIKVVVSKQELKEMLSSREGVSLGEMIAKLQARSGMAGAGDRGRPKKVWRPVLESIPEGLINDFPS